MAFWSGSCMMVEKEIKLVLKLVANTRARDTPRSANQHRSVPQAVLSPHAAPFYERTIDFWSCPSYHFFAFLRFRWPPELTQLVPIEFAKTVINDKQTVPGFFIQDNATTAEAVPPRFGLIDDSDNRWDTLRAEIDRLNCEAEEGTSYKVVIFGRHGEGFHNVAESKYGTQAWDDYWSKLNGDGELVWGPDAELTPLGEDQARAVNKAWKTEVAFNIPLPRRRYCSPMTRALSTYILTFEDIPLEYRPLVLENCREVYGVHTCDKRRSRTYISTTFPQFDIEKVLVKKITLV
ncbi:hypothetical protein MPER_12724, partial [Moniliophthora perniciosa FA553]